MAITTVFPEAGTGGGNVSVDGYSAESDLSWDTCHDSTSGDLATSDTATSLFIQSRFTSGDSLFRIWRIFTLFDTSSIPDGDIISAATYSLYVIATANGDNDGDDFLSVVNVTPAANNAIVAGDFDQCGDAIDNPTEGSDRIDLSVIGTSAYEDWTLDSTGIGWIDKAGITKLGMREGHDQIDSPIASAGSNNNNLEAASADTAGTSQDPKLVITHAAAAGIVPLRRRIEGC